MSSFRSKPLSVASSSSSTNNTTTASSKKPSSGLGLLIDSALGFILPKPTNSHSTSYFDDELSNTEFDELLTNTNENDNNDEGDDSDMIPNHPHNHHNNSIMNRNRSHSFAEEIELEETFSHNNSISNQIIQFNQTIINHHYHIEIQPNEQTIYSSLAITSTTNNKIDTLPKDILLIIFSYLNYPLLLNKVNLVNKEWFYLSQMNILWEKFFTNQIFNDNNHVNRKILFHFEDSSEKIPSFETDNENVLNALQNRFYMTLFDPNPNLYTNNNGDNENNGELSEENQLNKVKTRIEEEIIYKIENEYKIPTIKSYYSNQNEENELSNNNNMIKAPYVCDFYKECFFKLNHFVTTSKKQLEYQNKKLERMNFLYEMCHSSQYYFTFYLGVPLSALSLTLCMALQLVKSNRYNVDIEKDPNVIDLLWLPVFTFLYIPLVCSLIVTSLQLFKNILSFKLKKRQNIQKVIFVLMGLVFLIGVIGFVIMITFSAVFPLHPKYFAVGADTSHINLIGLRKLVNNYSVMMSPFLLSFIAIVFISWISQTLMLYNALVGTLRQKIIRHAGNTLLHLFFNGAIIGFFVLLNYSQKADASPSTEKDLTKTLWYIVFGMHILIILMNLLSAALVGFIIKRFCELFTPIPKQPLMKKYGIALFSCVLVATACSLGLEGTMIFSSPDFYMIPLLPVPTVFAGGFYVVAAMYNLWNA
ncbi:hypothetical protein ABK040_005034 [Willaertia magna]